MMPSYFRVLAYLFLHTAVDAASIACKSVIALVEIHGLIRTPLKKPELGRSGQILPWGFFRQLLLKADY